MDEDALFASLRDKLFTAVVGDVLDKMGWRRQFLPQAIAPLRPDMKVVGRAMPVLEADHFDGGRADDRFTGGLGLTVSRALSVDLGFDVGRASRQFAVSLFYRF